MSHHHHNKQQEPSLEEQIAVVNQDIGQAVAAVAHEAAEKADAELNGEKPKTKVKGIVYIYQKKTKHEGKKSKMARKARKAAPYLVLGAAVAAATVWCFNNYNSNP